MKLKYRLADSCFYIFWFFLQLGKALGYTSKNREFTILLLCGIPFAVVRMLLIRWDRGSLRKCICLNLLGIATALVSNTTTYLLSLFCITAVKDMEIKNILKPVLFIRGPAYVIRTTMAILGFADKQVSHRYADGAVSAVRYALGYEHPNTAQFELFMLVLILFYLYRHRIELWHYAVLLWYAFFIFGYTNSKTAFCLELVFLCAAAICSWREGKLIRQIAIKLSAKSWIIGAVFTITGCILYIWLPSFRDLGTFSSRFLTATNIIRNRSISLLGNSNITTDLGYVYILYDGGILLAWLFFWGVNKLLKTRLIQSDIVLCLAFACFSIFNIMEAYTYSVLSNAMLLYLAYIVYPQMYGKALKDSENTASLSKQRKLFLNKRGKIVWKRN